MESDRPEIMQGSGLRRMESMRLRVKGLDSGQASSVHKIHPTRIPQGFFQPQLAPIRGRSRPSFFPDLKIVERLLLT